MQHISTGANYLNSNYYGKLTLINSTLVPCQFNQSELFFRSRQPELKTMTNLQKISQTNLKIKAAMMLNRKPSQIKSVVENVDGAGVECSNGNHLIIPLAAWIGTDFE